MIKDYKVIFEQAKTPMLLVDLEGKLIDWNKSYRSLIGYKDLSQPIDFTPEIFSPKYQENGQETSQYKVYILNKLIQKGSYNFTWQHRDLEGLGFTSYIAGKVIQIEGHKLIIFSFFNETRQKDINRLINKKTSHLEKQNTILSSFFNNSIIGLMISDSNRIITKTNQRMADILKTSQEEILGNTLEKFCISKEYYNDFGKELEQLIKEGKPLKNEILYKAADGSQVWCTFSGSSLNPESPNDYSNGFLWIIEDITDKKLLEIQLKEQYKLAKDSNPLTGLPGNNTIKNRIKDSVHDHAQRCILYIDLDNFKTYNDYYGFAKGDDVLIYTSSVLICAGRDLDIEDYFIGNIGGDDFVVVADANYMKQIASYIIHSFEQSISSYYTTIDVSNGYIKAKNRAGNLTHTPLMTISVAGVSLDTVPNLNYFEVIDVCSELKIEAKKIQASTFTFNRRDL